MVLGGHHVDVSARINHCHSPVDVSFLVVANNDRNPSSQNTDMVSFALFSASFDVKIWIHSNKQFLFFYHSNI